MSARGENWTTKEKYTLLVAFLQFNIFLQEQGVESSRFLVSRVTGMKRLVTTDL